MSEKVASRESILIAIVAAAGDNGLDHSQLQKSVFLVGEELKDRLPDNFYRFDPYMYGPYSQGVRNDIDRLCDGPLVDISTDNRNRPWYSLGSNAKRYLLRLPEDLASGVRKIVEWVTSMPFDELVRAVYYLYPEQRANSIFQGYTDEKAEEESFQRAFSEIAAGKGRPALELVDELQGGTAVE